MRAAWHFARLCPRWCHSHRLSRSAADSRSTLRVTSLEKAPASGPPAGLGFNSEIALEGFRKLPRRVLSAAGFQRGRKPARGRGRWSRPPAQRQKRFTRCPMQTVAQAAGQRLNRQGVVRRDGRPGCLSRERRHFWNLHRGSRAIRRGQAHGTCRWGAAGAHDQGSWWRQSGEFASPPTPRLRIALPNARAADRRYSAESATRPPQGIGVLWLFVVSEVQLHQALGAKQFGRPNMPGMRAQPVIEHRDRRPPEKSKGWPRSTMAPWSVASLQDGP